MSHATDSQQDLILGLLEQLTPHGADASFSDRAVGDEEAMALLAAGRVAPSADNAQTWRFITVREQAARAALAAAAPGPLAGALAAAPLALVVCGVPWVVTRTRREQPFVIIDVPIAVTHILLQATELGLTCCWSLDCDEQGVRDALGVPQEVRVVAVLALGWPPA